MRTIWLPLMTARTPQAGSPSPAGGKDELFYTYPRSSCDADQTHT